jgi:hypothetical protein
MVAATELFMDGGSGLQGFPEDVNIGGRARSVGAQGAHIMGWHGQGAAQPPGVADSLPYFVSPSDSMNVSEK